MATSSVVIFSTCEPSRSEHYDEALSPVALTAAFMADRYHTLREVSGKLEIFVRFQPSGPMKMRVFVKMCADGGESLLPSCQLNSKSPIEKESPLRVRTTVQH